MDPQLAGASPGPARVPGNHWIGLKVPTVGSWTPTEPLSVVIPHYEAPAALRLTLEALAGQTYPAHLVQVLVIDDGSDRAPCLPASLGLNATVIVQERRGFGLARARNLGAAHADGTIVVFLDCDMVPEPCHLEAHARWHHVASDAVTIGFRIHVMVDHIEPEQVRRAAARGGLEPLFAHAAQYTPEYVEFHMERTADLSSDADDLFRLVTGGNLGIRKETFAAVGGYDGTFDQWGGEDTEFGYRLFTYGCPFVPERLALCWHQGMPGYLDEVKQRSLHEQRARLAHLIPHPGFRRSLPGRSFARPRLVVTVKVESHAAVNVAATVESVLANTFHDLAVCLDIPGDHPDRRWLARQFGEDPRVHVGEGVDALQRFAASPLHLRLPPVVTVAPDGLENIVKRLENPAQPIGLLHLTLPGTSPEHALGKAFRTRAWLRALRLADGDVEPVIGELFGEQWVPGPQYGFQALAQVKAEQAAPLPPEPLMPVAATPDLAAIQRFVRELDPGQRALLLQIANRGLRLRESLKALRRARTWSQLQWSVRGVFVAVLPDRTTQAIRAKVLAPYRRGRGKGR